MAETTTPVPVPEAYRDLIDKPLVIALATTLPDGTPQVTPVWFYEEDGYFYVNTAVGRLKDKAMRANPYVAGMVLDPQNPYRYFQIRGPIVAFTEGPAGRAGINRLSERYTGNPVYRGPADEARVNIKIAPQKVLAEG